MITKTFPVLKLPLLTLCLLMVCNHGFGQNEQEQFTNNWELEQPILSHGPEDSFDEISVKDPSVIYFENVWHLFYTARSKNEYTTGYVSAGNLKDLNSAKRHQLQSIRGITPYGCAPQVLFFEPQQKWYLIFQNRDANYQPVFSTNTDISKPELWSNYKNLVEKDSPAKWIDFWIIADVEKVYLFYTEGHNGVIVRSTSIEEFPTGWKKSKKVFDDVHEAVHIYKVKRQKEFHMIYELNKNGIRSFGLAKSDDLDGQWKKVTDEYATGKQLKIKGDNWTEMISHGEVIRSGYNQNMEYEPKSCRWLIQGIRIEELDEKYELLPWQLGIIKKSFEY